MAQIFADSSRPKEEADRPKILPFPEPLVFLRLPKICVNLRNLWLTKTLGGLTRPVPNSFTLHS